MIPLLWPWLVQKLGGIGARLGAVLIALALVALMVWQALATLDNMLDDADRRGEMRERQRWEAEIARSNVKVLEAQAAAERAVREADARAASEIASLRQSLESLDKANDTLPNPDAGGIDRDRVRVLRQPPGAGHP